MGGSTYFYFTQVQIMRFSVLRIFYLSVECSLKVLFLGVVLRFARPKMVSEEKEFAFSFP